MRQPPVESFPLWAWLVFGAALLACVAVDLIGELKYLRYGLAAVLGSSAMKLATARWIQISPAASIKLILICIAATIWPSVRALRCIAREAARREALDVT